MESSTNPNQRRATWVSYDTMTYRREKKLCLRCGNLGHMVKECKFLPPQRPFTVAGVKGKGREVDLSRAEAGNENGGSGKE